MHPPSVVGQPTSQDVPTLVWRWLAGGGKDVLTSPPSAQLQAVLDEVASTTHLSGKSEKEASLQILKEKYGEDSRSKRNHAAVAGRTRSIETSGGRRERKEVVGRRRKKRMRSSSRVA
ncbi:MAG: hypothetical protein SGPRY_005615 [Prymnesium sp.]